MITETGYRRRTRVATGSGEGDCSACHLGFRAGDWYYTYAQEFCAPYQPGPVPRPHHRDCERPQGADGPRRDVAAVRAQERRHALACEYRYAVQLLLRIDLADTTPRGGTFDRHAEGRRDAILAAAADDGELRALLDEADARIATRA